VDSSMSSIHTQSHRGQRHSNTPELKSNAWVFSLYRILFLFQLWHIAVPLT
jgi:hypothetical protein